jgi:hypothetical protein
MEVCELVSTCITVGNHNYGVLETLEMALLKKSALKLGRQYLLVQPWINNPPSHTHKSDAILA